MDAFHLPGWRPRPETEWQTLVAPNGRSELRVPILDTGEIEDLVQCLASARTALAERPVAEIVATIDAAAVRLGDPDGPYRRMAERYLTDFTGYSPAMVDLVLERMIADWREPALRQLLTAEFGQPELLDAFRPVHAGGTLTRAYGPRLSFHIFAGNVPGVAVTSIVRALLVKSAVFGKTASGEPVLPVLFARALARTAPWLGECLAITYWPGGRSDIEEPLLRSAELVVVYGGEEVVRDVRRRVSPTARMVVHGPRVSLGLVGRAALKGEASVTRLAADVARSVAAFDQQGCVSPHVLYVERGGALEPARLARLVASELERLQAGLPRGDVSDSEAALIRSLRASAEFRAAQDPRVAVYSASGTEFTVVHDPDPTFVASCLNRFLWVKPIDDAAMLPALIAPFAGFVQSVAIAGLGPRALAIAGELGALGASRISSFAALPWPPPQWHHDGAEPLRELVRWVDFDDGDAGGEIDRDA